MSMTTNSALIVPAQPPVTNGAAGAKVTRDALHLLLAYELEKQTRDGKTVFLPAHWKLITLQDLEVDLKFEFNQSNRGLYGREPAVLGEDGNRP